MVVAIHPMSASEYLATADSRPRHTELIDGTVVVNEPKMPHARAQTRMIYHLQAWIESGEGRGYVTTPTDIVVNDRNVFAPDVWWVGEHRQPGAGQLDLDGLPDLIVEIRSPSTWARDLGVKLPTYEAAGVPEAWFVDTEARSVLVFRRSNVESPTFDVAAEIGADSDLTSPLLEGFVVQVGSIFER
ncbi:MAG TPA: Uma2 family endonuclease [Acidimicrobiales bacterium]|nr:Uma2 family endonuclease [Acidimicrobiales bacterium]